MSEVESFKSPGAVSHRDDIDIVTLQPVYDSESSDYDLSQINDVEFGYDTARQRKVLQPGRRCEYPRNQTIRGWLRVLGDIPVNLIKVFDSPERPIYVCHLSRRIRLTSSWGMV